MKPNVATTVGGHVLATYDVMDDRLLEMLSAFVGAQPIDVIYTDPPWGDGLVKRFASMANREAGLDVIPTAFATLIDRLGEIIDLVKPKDVFIEMGTRWTPPVEDMLRQRSGHFWSGEYAYAGTRPFTLFGAAIGPHNAPQPPSKDLHGVPLVIDALDLPPDRLTVLDPFCGNGYTAQAALKNGLAFVGNEINPARAAKTLQVLQRG